MEGLLATICLTIAVLLGSAGVGYALPPCPGSYNASTWDNCYGTFNTKYVGEYRDSTWHGQGPLTTADGAKYVGEFRNDKIHVKGTYTSADGQIKKGIWKDGAFQQPRQVIPQDLD